jgi:hypothetical protein
VLTIRRGASLPAVARCRQPADYTSADALPTVAPTKAPSSRSGSRSLQSFAQRFWLCFVVLGSDKPPPGFAEAWRLCFFFFWFLLAAPRALAYAAAGGRCVK